MKLLVVAFCSLIFVPNKGIIASQVVKESELIVELDHLGKIRGHILKSAEENDFYAFQDIPYAQPPIGKNRFRPSKPIDPWEGILNATFNSKVCPQPTNPDIESFNITEDCLVLNVYTPVKPSSNESLPVFFWIHGGGFMVWTGAMPYYNPKYLIDYDIIVVTINYRLGAFGFLTTLDENLPGNLGLKDQLLALKWTHDHIHKFGGDPKKITIGGESAGSMSAGFQLLSKSAKGLLRGIIQQSGSPLSGLLHPTNQSELAFEFGKQLNSSFTSKKSSDLLQVLQQASYSDLLNLQNKFDSGESLGFMNGLTYRPVIENGDYDDAFLTEPMHSAFMDGHFNLVPTLIGFNSEECVYFLSIVSNEVVEERATFLDKSPAHLVSEFLNVAEEDKKTVGNKIKRKYKYSSFMEDKNALVKYTTDEVFIRSILRQAETTSQYVPVYLYELSWLPEGSTEIGVPHVADLWYFWGGQTPSKTNENLRKPLIKLWTNFIKYQNPTPVVDEELQNVIWPVVQPNAVKYFDINSEFKVKENPRNYYYFKSLLDRYIRPPYITY